MWGFSKGWGEDGLHPFTETKRGENQILELKHAMRGGGDDWGQQVSKSNYGKEEVEAGGKETNWSEDLISLGDQGGGKSGSTLKRPKDGEEGSGKRRAGSCPPCFLGGPAESYQFHLTTQRKSKVESRGLILDGAY